MLNLEMEYQRAPDTAHNSHHKELKGLEGKGINREGD